MSTGKNAKPDALDHIEKYATKRQVQQAYFATDGPRALALVTGAKIVQAQLNQKAWELYQFIKQIDEDDLWGQIPRDLLTRISARRMRHRATNRHAMPDIEFCRGKTDGCKALGLPQDTERFLAFVEANSDCAMAQRLAILPPAALRDANRLPKAQKKALLAEAKELSDLLPQDAAERLVEIIVSHTAAVTAKSEQDRVRADDELNRRLESDRKLAKSIEKGKESEAQRKGLQTQVDELKKELDTPAWAKGAESVRELAAWMSLEIDALDGNIDRMVAPLVARVEKGQPNHHLNRVALSVLIMGARTFGEAFTQILPLLDPGQDCTLMWKTLEMFSNDATRESLDEFVKIACSTRKKVKSNDGA